MSMMLLLLSALTGLLLCACVACGWFFGVVHDRGRTGTILGLVIGIVLSGALISNGVKYVVRSEIAELRSEADPRRYATIAALKGRYCDVDRSIAKAIGDRRLTVEEAMAIETVYQAHSDDDAKAKLLGAGAKAPCPADTTQTTPTTAQDTGR